MSVKKTTKRKHSDIDGKEESLLSQPDAPPAKRRRMDESSKNEKANKEKKKPKKKYKYHPGALEPDYDGDYWADHDERCHGLIDSNAMRRKYPEGFCWDCCDATGDESGCELRSRPQTPLSEKYATSPEPTLDEVEYYHDGELEVDYECWADHDEDCHGPIDTKTNRREYPEGFRWSCCNAEGTYAQGCCKRE